MTPEQEEQVRRALAAAGAARSPIPPEVAARLDDTLADLVADRRPAGPDEVAAVRRRRRARALVAAASVCLLALVGAALVRTNQGGGQGGGQGEASSGAGSQAAPRQVPPGGAPRPLPQLHSRSLTGDVTRLLADGSPSAFAARPQQRPQDTASARCDLPSTRAGDRLLAVRLDGRPATLRVGPVAGGTRVAQVYSCDGASAPVATTRVPAR